MAKFTWRVRREKAVHLKSYFLKYQTMDKKIKVFLVEDDENFGSVLQSYLEINDYEVDWFKNGKEAADRFQKACYDICILDVMLPGADGYSLARTIKSKEPQIPMIF